MGSNHPLTFSNPFTRFDLLGDKAVFQAIVADMLAHGGELAPSEHWNWKLGKWHAELETEAAGYSDELFEKKYSQLAMMLDPWIGITGMRTLAAESVAKYEGFLRAVDHLELLPPDVLAHGQANGWRETDLGTVMDCNLICAFSDRPSTQKIAICEVGGGYGRLAEAMLGGLWESMHYVLVDAVPGSLMYAYLYLRTQFPQLRIGAYFNGDPYDDSYHCYILPAWHTHLLGDMEFDICVNIESLQEMEQHHVDYYLGLFDRVARQDGQIYLSNARDYVFKGEWKVPPHWETNFLNNTPRSWTADHPTQIFQKRVGDFSRKRWILEGVFKQQMEAWHKDQLLAEQQLHILDRDRICGELQQTIDQMASQIAQAAEAAGQSEAAEDKAPPTRDTVGSAALSGENTIPSESFVVSRLKRIFSRFQR